MVGGYQIIDLDKYIDIGSITVTKDTEQDKNLSLIYEVLSAFRTVGSLPTSTKLKKPFVFRFNGNLFNNFTTYINRGTNSTYVCFKSALIGYVTETPSTGTVIKFDDCPIPSQTALLHIEKSINNTQKTTTYKFSKTTKVS